MINDFYSLLCQQWVKREKGIPVQKLTVHAVRVFLSERLSYHWTRMTKNRKLILSSFSRVGLSLPIDGSRDEEIKIQGCENLQFEPIVSEEYEKISISEGDIEEKRFEVKPPTIIDEVKNLGASRETNTNTKPKRRRRILPTFLFSKPTRVVDDLAFDRYSDHWYYVDSACDDFEERLDRCEDVEYTDRRFDKLMEEVFEMADVLEDVCREVRDQVSKQPTFDLFTPASQILMFTDPVEDARIDDLTKRMKDLEAW